MMKRQIGNTGLYVNSVGLGCMGLSHAYGSAVPMEEGIEFLKQSFKEGYIFLTPQKFMWEKPKMELQVTMKK